MYSFKPEKTILLRDLVLTKNISQVLTDSPVYLVEQRQKVGVIISPDDWQEIKQYLWEIQDTDEAIKIAQKEAMLGRLNSADSFKQILQDAEKNED